MSLDQPSRAFDAADTSWCAECAAMRSGAWVGDPTHAMDFLCSVCGHVTDPSAVAER